MSHEEFIELVHEMRQIQKFSFLHHPWWALLERIKLEMQVDHAIAAYKKINSIGSDGTLAENPVAGNHKN